jgi:hypothetical protein
MSSSSARSRQAYTVQTADPTDDTCYQTHVLPEGQTRLTRSELETLVGGTYSIRFYSPVRDQAKVYCTDGQARGYPGNGPASQSDLTLYGNVVVCDPALLPEGDDLPSDETYTVYLQTAQWYHGRHPGKWTREEIVALLFGDTLSAKDRGRVKLTIAVRHGDSSRVYVYASNGAGGGLPGLMPNRLVSTKVGLQDAGRKIWGGVLLCNADTVPVELLGEGLLQHLASEETALVRDAAGDAFADVMEDYLEHVARDTFKRAGVPVNAQPAAATVPPTNFFERQAELTGLLEQRNA